jgi:arginase
MSRLRARCPSCRTLTAVAVDEGYECHACGARFGAGLVRVPRAWGSGGEQMAVAAGLPVPFPEAAVVDEETLAAQNEALAVTLPRRPIVLGGCCCAHVGAVRGLAELAGGTRVAVVWIDAHGDLNTPETSPSGNAWGMPLRMLLDTGILAVEDTALVAARNLDPAEQAYVDAVSLPTGEQGVERALRDADAVYVAFDVDALEPGEAAVWLPEPGGLTLPQAEALLERVREQRPVAGAGFTGLVPDERNVAVVARLAGALGL